MVSGSSSLRMEAEGGGRSVVSGSARLKVESGCGLVGVSHTAPLGWRGKQGKIPS